jgi:hypothetical protein
MHSYVHNGGGSGYHYEIWDLAIIAPIPPLKNLGQISTGMQSSGG